MSGARWPRAFAGTRSSVSSGAPGTLLGGAFAPALQAPPAWAAPEAVLAVVVVAAAGADVCAGGAEDDDDADDEDDEPHAASASARAAATAARIDGRTGRVCHGRRQALVFPRERGGS